MSNENKLLGLQGEDLALEYLTGKGFILIGRNIKLFCGEIDILMQDKKDLVIVEVKTKSDASFGFASEMITYKKKRKLLQLAKALWQKFPQKKIRIDVVALDEDKIDHITSAVEE
jgi:putative endonuclease